jgi:hypothetical protein
MKLTELQYYLLTESLAHADKVLKAMKAKPLRGRDLVIMKALETAAQHLEFTRLSVQVPHR